MFLYYKGALFIANAMSIFDRASQAQIILVIVFCVRSIFFLTLVTTPYSKLAQEHELVITVWSTLPVYQTRQ